MSLFTILALAGYLHLAGDNKFIGLRVCEQRLLLKEAEASA